jgi:formylmethanofuran dehydrogenase subunit D
VDIGLSFSPQCSSTPLPFLPNMPVPWVIVDNGTETVPVPQFHDVGKGAISPSMLKIDSVMTKDLPERRAS